MKLEIKLFGVTRDILGKISLETDFNENLTAGNLLATLKQQYPALAKLSSIMIAVNMEYADYDTIINSNDEIALIPPVSGG